MHPDPGDVGDGADAGTRRDRSVFVKDAVERGRQGLVDDLLD
jgi:hypothetical protein